MGIFCIFALQNLHSIPAYYCITTTMKKKMLFLASLMALCFASLGLQAQAPKANYQVVPRPEKVHQPAHQKAFNLNAQTRILAAKDAASLRNARFLQQFIAERTGLKLTIVHKAKGDNIIRLGNRLAHNNKEGYALTVNTASISIEGASAAGTFYGIQTLRKSLPHLADKASVATTGIDLPQVTIVDAPRFAYRGAHLDVARHFVNTDSIRRFIDLIALHNINRFHWHLTDDQGWRIEIKRYPRLTEVGSRRSGTVIKKNWGTSDGIPYGGYYTQNELRDIVRYAAERHITIIPEIDLPGHMQGALAAYPHLGCTGGPYEVWRDWGVSDDVLCAGNPEIYPFIYNVLDEVMQIFPSEYIHVGGDECPKKRWKECPKCQAKIAEEGLHADGKHSAEERLQSYVIHKAAEHLTKRGRKMIGWDETLEGGLAPGATVMSWRGEAGGLEAARLGHDAIMTPNSYLYFDYYQAKNTQHEPFGIGGYLPLKTVYSYEPVPDKATPQEASRIIGVQANLWTEYVKTFKHLEYMELPRMAALAEIQWTPRGTKSYDEFLTRLPWLLDLYREKDYNFARHIYDVQANYKLDPVRGIVASFRTEGVADIRYTLDGNDPTASSTLYSTPLVISNDAKLRVAAFRKQMVDGRQQLERSHIEGEDFLFAKSTAKNIQLLQGINAQYRFEGPSVLVDGLRGSNTNFQTGRWLGFNKEEMEAVIDFGTPTSFSRVAFNACIDKGSWLYGPRRVVISTSEDGVNFVALHTQDFPEMTEADANAVRPYSFTLPTTTARYLKVHAIPEKSIPAWHEGAAGHPAFLFVDEIVVE